MDDHFDICRVFEISKFDIARLTCISDIYIICDFEFEWMRQQLSVNFFSCEKGVTERCFINSFITMVHLFLYQP